MISWSWWGAHYTVNVPINGVSEVPVILKTNPDGRSSYKMLLNGNPGEGVSVDHIQCKRYGIPDGIMCVNWPTRGMTGSLILIMGTLSGSWLSHILGGNKEESVPQCMQFMALFKCTFNSYLTSTHPVFTPAELILFSSCVVYSIMNNNFLCERYNSIAV